MSIMKNLETLGKGNTMVITATIVGVGLAVAGVWLQNQLPDHGTKQDPQAKGRLFIIAGVVVAATGFALKYLIDENKDLSVFGGAYVITLIIGAIIAALTFKK